MSGRSVAIVTGARRGIGRAIATMFAANPHRSLSKRSGSAVTIGLMHEAGFPAMGTAAHVVVVGAPRSLLAYAIGRIEELEAR